MNQNGIIINLDNTSQIVLDGIFILTSYYLTVTGQWLANIQAYATNLYTEGGVTANWASGPVVNVVSNANIGGTCTLQTYVVFLTTDSISTEQ